MDPRKRTFPMRLMKIEPTPSNPSGVQLFYAHEWEAYQKSLQPDQPTDEPAKPNDATAETTAELANAVPGSPSECATSSPSSIHRNFSIPPDFSRHSRRCAVCSHPDRDAIEGDFIRWRSPGTIARDYKIADRSSIYRHAHSTGLFAWRKRELGRTLESILESCEDIPLESADVIIRAARIYAHLDEHGKWFEPPRTNFFFHGPAPTLGTLESDFPTNSARSRERTPKEIPEGEEKVLAAEASSSAEAANHNCRPDEGRHPEPAAGGGVEGTLSRPNEETDIHFWDEGEEKANRNIHQFKNSVNSMNPEEKANS